MSSSVEDCEEKREVFYQDLGMEEEDEDLFEIDLEAVNCIPPPASYWESYFTSTGNVALLANCLMPISHISSAIPAVSFDSVVLIPEPISLGEYLRLPFLGGFGFIDHEKMKARFQFQFQR